MTTAAGGGGPVDAMPLMLTFLGTRGEIDIRSRLHRRHSALLVGAGEGRIMIDRGADWLHLRAGLRPDAILLTHAHHDHAGGLAAGADCPVYATTETLDLLARYPIAEPNVVRPRTPFSIGGIAFESFPLAHSLRAPAVGYRIATPGVAVFYAPDVAAIVSRREALAGIALYVGDGATLLRSMVRSRGSALIGHASIREQLDWCRQAGVGRAIFTHCGSGIVRGDGRRMSARVRRLGQDYGVDATIARDGLTLAVARGEG